MAAWMQRHVRTRVARTMMSLVCSIAWGTSPSEISLLHVLFVTPVIFFWIHERRLRLQREALPEAASARINARGLIVVAAILAALIAGTVALRQWWQPADDEAARAGDAHYVWREAAR